MSTARFWLKGEIRGIGSFFGPGGGDLGRGARCETHTADGDAGRVSSRQDLRVSVDYGLDVLLVDGLDERDCCEWVLGKPSTGGPDAGTS